MKPIWKVEPKPNEMAMLKQLLIHREAITSSALAASCSVSVRSIKTYVGNINANFPGLIAASREGYQITDTGKASMIINQDNVNRIPRDSEERKSYLLKKLLIEQEQCSIEDLASELYITPETLLSEINKMKPMMIEFDLTLKTKMGFLTMDGPTYNKKKLLSRMIYEDSKKSFLSLSLMQHYLPKYDLQKVKEIIQSTLLKHHFFMDDFSLLNFVLHIAITMERTANDFIAVEETKEIPINNHILEIIAEIASQINTEFQIAFTNKERYEFSLLIMTRVISKSIGQITMTQLTDIVGNDILVLVSKIQQKVKETFNISITNQDFTIRFSLHVRNLLTRLENNIVLQNLQMQNIKNSYPFIYDVSVFIANIMMQDSGHTLSEDEIAYIALHIGVLIEERKAFKMKVKVVFLHPQYFFNSLDAVQRCIELYQESLLVVGIVSSEEELQHYSDYDLLISTIPLHVLPTKRFLQISYALSQKDQEWIEYHVDDIMKSRAKEKMKENLQILFREELYFPHSNDLSKEEIINEMCDSLEKHAYVDDTFRQKIFEREAISPSAYANIAMPHPLEMCALRSTIAVSLHPNAIDWNVNQVNIVFMIATNVEDKLFFKEIFDFITDIILDSSKVNQLLQIKDYDEFIATLVSLI